MNKIRLNQKTKGILLVTILFLGIVGIGVGTFAGLDSYNANVHSYSSGGLAVNVTPGTVEVPESIASFVSIDVVVQDSVNFSHILIVLSDGISEKQIVNSSMPPRPYFLTRLSIPLSYLQNGARILVSVDNSTAVSLHVDLQPSYFGIIADVILVLGVSGVVVFLLFFEVRTKRYWLLLPVFVALSALYGQRYDTFFMISLGMRIYDGVNPYFGSTLVAPGLTWEYPPGFMPWSYVSALAYHYFFGYQIPNAGSLNYISTIYLEGTSAWRALEGSNLFLLYGMIKLPFVFSFLWIASILEKIKGKIPWRLWLLNPFAILVCVIWGQLDVLALAFMLQSILYFREEKSFMAALFAGFGTLIKLFPVFIIPYIIFRTKNKTHAIVGVVLVSLLGIAMYSASGSITQDLQTIVFGRASATYLGVFNSNGLSWQILIQGFGVSHFPSLFEYVFIPAYLILTYFAIRGRIPVSSYFIMTMLLFFLTYNFVNPQYLLWLIPMYIISERKMEVVVFSLLASVYVALDYSYSYFMNPMLSWNYFASALGQVEHLRTNATTSYLVLGPLALISAAYFALSLLKEYRIQRGISLLVEAS